MIEYSYAKDYPKPQELQGGLLYPVEIETVKFEDGDQYRFKYLKFPTGTKVNQKMIDAYLADDVDLQAETFKHPLWVSKAQKHKKESVRRCANELVRKAIQ